MSRSLFEYHEVLGYRFIPNLKARVPFEQGGYLVQTNAHGFRSSHAFAAEKAEGTRRVLVFGDSFSAGVGVANSHRYSDLLRDRLAVEIYNFALPGTGTDQQYLTWREFGRGVAHDAIVIAVLVENIRRVAARFRAYADDAGQEQIYAKPYFTVESGKLQLHHVPPAREPISIDALPAEDREHVDAGGGARFQRLRQVANALGAKDLLQKLTGYQPLPEYDSPDSPAWQVMRAILKEWICASSRPVLLVPLPLYQHVEETADAGAYQARFAELAAEVPCTLHDPLPDLRRYSAADRRRFRFEKDIHLTPSGHRAIADSLAPALQRLLDGKVHGH